eukprot:1195748-Prorocentrum_minimum.AAC.1
MAVVSRATWSADAASWGGGAGGEACGGRGTAIWAGASRWVLGREVVACARRGVGASFCRRARRPGCEPGRHHGTMSFRSVRNT